MQVVGPGGLLTELSWLPGSGAHARFDKRDVSFEQEWAIEAYQAEYILAHMLLDSVPRGELDGATWVASDLLVLSLQTHEIEWRATESGLILSAIVSMRDSRGPACRHEYSRPELRENEFDARAHERRMFLPEPDGGWREVNTATLVESESWAEVPEGTFEVDTSNAWTSDKSSDNVYDDRGNIVGKRMRDSPRGAAVRAPVLLGIVGAGCIATAGAVWWLRRRGVA